MFDFFNGNQSIYKQNKQKVWNECAWTQIWIPSLCNKHFYKFAGPQMTA